MQLPVATLVALLIAVSCSLHVSRVAGNYLQTGVFFPNGVQLGGAETEGTCEGPSDGGRLVWNAAGNNGFGDVLQCGQAFGRWQFISLGALAGVDSTPPEIHYTGGEVVTIEAGSSWTEPGPVYATDNYPADPISVSSNLPELGSPLSAAVFTAGAVVEYSAVDSHGNNALRTRSIHFTDTTAPVIHVAGQDPLSASRSSDSNAHLYLPEDVYATDNVAWSVATNALGMVVASNASNIDFSVSGTYIVEYTFVDGAGIAAVPVYRTIIISDLFPNACDAYGVNGTLCGALVANLQLWVRPESLPSLGTRVEEWPDESGQYNNAYVPRTDLGGVEEINGKNITAPVVQISGSFGTKVLRFDGTETSHASMFFPDSLVVQRPYTVFIVNRYYDPEDTNGRTLQSRTNATNWLVGLWRHRHGYHPTSWVSNHVGFKASTRWHLSSAVTDANGSVYYHNGDDYTMNATQGGDPMHLALNGAGQYAEFSLSEVAEILIFNTAMTSTQRELVESYLLTKYQLDDKLEGWLTGDKLDGMTSISSWPSRSRNKVPATTVGGLYGTPVTVTESGATMAHFTAADSDRLRFETPFHLSQEYTVMVVSRYAGSTRGRVLSGLETQNNWLLGHWGGNHGMHTSPQGWVYGPATFSNPLGWNMYTAWQNPFASPAIAYYEGRSKLATSTLGNAVGELDVGAGWGAEYSDSRVAEVIVFNRPLDLVELDGWFDYLQDKYDFL